MNNIKIKTVVTAVSMALLASGCASMKEAERNVAETKVKSKEIFDKSQKVAPNATTKSDNFTKINRNWVDPTPLKQSELALKRNKLPSFFQDKVSLTLPGKVSLIEVASELQRSNKIKFIISQDVYNVSRETGRLIKGDTQITDIIPNVPQGVNPDDVGTNGAVPIFLSDFVVRGATLESALDLMASKGNVAWSWNGSAIEIYRYETKTYNIAALSGQTTTNSTVAIQSDVSGGGGTGGQAANASGVSGQATSGVTRTSITTSWDDVRAYLVSMLSPSGTIAVLESAGVVTVKDTPAVQARIGKAIKELNTVIGQQIYMDVNVYSVVVSDEDNYGVNWNVVWEKMSRGIAVSLANSIPAATGATQIGVTVADGRFTGSSAMFNALSTIGQTSVVNQFSISTLNGQATPIGNNRKISFIQSITSTPSTTVGVAPAVQINPGAVYQGIGMSVTPRLQKDTDKMLLEYSLSLNDVEAIEPFTTGAGDNAQTIQLPTTTVKNILQRASLKSGQTLILSGFKQSNSNLTYSGVGSARNQALGGNRNAQNSSQYLVITVTPYVAQDNN
ncbi:MAG: hypothetical protein C0448_16030 [Sphingobacteriaceae bacterium]|nr:hypothetical protein [Sphingobacteriaceae bacterium]